MSVSDEIAHASITPGATKIGQPSRAARLSASLGRATSWDSSPVRRVTVA